MNEELNFDDYQQKLLALRQELLATAAVRAEAGQTVALDQTRTGRLSRMDALQGQAMALATTRRINLQLQRIEAALIRIEKGSYGLCQQCEEPIATRRLNTDPATPLCIHCAERR